ncbi:type 1 glutamine amidotransferase [Yasminevirus sp. GU-2018]|uniref:Type 1 glutamine amidotransferase n=1 Tax=Yasminevirus sp. GU-2018 TaxID=2420051 RepID=A0A5K0U9N7_9VIRU|nr:type 1 glutamine amidotransferase [Yasminevirus sp. GU-2018]
MKRVLIIKNGVCDVDKSLMKLLCEIDQGITPESITVTMSRDLVMNRDGSMSINDYACMISKQVDCIIVCGGQQSLVDRALPFYRHPYLNELIKYVRVWIEADVHILGICLGAQIIGEACGVKTKRLHCPVNGFNKDIQVVKQENTLNNVCLLGDWFSPHIPYVLSCHMDYVGINMSDVDLSGSDNNCATESNLIVEAVMKNKGDYIPYAFRINSSYGVQFHPEMDDTLFNQVMGICSDLKEHTEFRERNSDSIKKTSIEIFKRWLSFVKVSAIND